MSFHSRRYAQEIWQGNAITVSSVAEAEAIIVQYGELYGTTIEYRVLGNGKILVSKSSSQLQQLMDGE